FTAQIKAFEDARQNLDNEDFLIPNEIASATFEPLDEADSSQISESLSLLLWTVESARRVNASVGTGNEAEARLCWDVLIYLSFTGPSENVSTRVLLERMLPLPLNPAADCVASGKADVLKAFAHASLKRTKINRDLCSAAYVLGPQLTAVLRLQFEAAFAASYARQAEVKQFLRGDYAKLILERAEHETDKAKLNLGARWLPQASLHPDENLVLSSLLNKLGLVLAFTFIPASTVLSTPSSFSLFTQWSFSPFNTKHNYSPTHHLRYACTRKRRGYPARSNHVPHGMRLSALSAIPGGRMGQIDILTVKLGLFPNYAGSAVPAAFYDWYKKI
ncbi:hypothetical protein CPB85DRAFT_1262839, partial [Mucidula mucida]